MAAFVSVPIASLAEGDNALAVCVDEGLETRAASTVITKDMSPKAAG